MGFSTYEGDDILIEHTGNLKFNDDVGYLLITCKDDKPQSVRIINRGHNIRFCDVVIDGLEYFAEADKSIDIIIEDCVFVDNSLNTLEVSGIRQLVEFKDCKGNGKLEIKGDVQLFFRDGVPLNITDLDTSNITNMSHMFLNCRNFDQDISGWDVSKVTDMSRMFLNCENFDQDISGWDVSNVTDMNSMFVGCFSFHQDISGWDVSNVTNMAAMFEGCENFNQDISRWNVSKVTNMWSMFSECPIREEFKPKKTKPYDRVIKQLNEVEEVGPHPDDCGICADGLHNDVKITLPRTENNCGHTFHAGCLIAWKDTGRDCCPLCRTGFPGEVAFHRGETSVMTKF